MSLPRGFCVATVVRVTVIMLVLFPEGFPREIFFSVGVDVDLGCGNSATHHTGNLQPRAEIESGDCVLEERRGHSCIHSAQKHVATDAGKTVKVGYTHRVKSEHHKGHKGSQGKNGTIHLMQCSLACSYVPFS